MRDRTLDFVAMTMALPSNRQLTEQHIWQTLTDVQLSFASKTAYSLMDEFCFNGKKYPNSQIWYYVTYLRNNPWLRASESYS